MIQPPIDFVEDGHIYTVDGARKLSVTQVLELAGLSDWSGVPDDVLWAAQQRGKAVHKARHLLDRGTLDESTVDERIGGYLEGWKKFKRDQGVITIQASERLVYRRIRLSGEDVVDPQETDLEIVGRLDVIAILRMHQGGVLVDVKTGDKTPAWPVQTAAYLKGHMGYPGMKRMCSRLFKEGTYKIDWHPMRDFDTDWGRFHRALIEAKRMELQAA